MSGVPITTKLPYGYVKDPNDKNKWLVDDYAASIVRKIFDLCLKGLGPSQIANKLKEERILRPYHYWKQTKGKNMWVIQLISNVPLNHSKTRRKYFVLKKNG